MDRAVFGKDCFDRSSDAFSCPRSSTETYSSAASEEELFDEPESHDPSYNVPEYTEITHSNLRASTPQDFASFFPSLKRFYIRHDNSSYDGNMNLRVDTEAGTGVKKSLVQLFHLRMHDLKKREFSLRRYERSSGREVCHASRKYAKSAAEKRPGLQRSMSSALATIRGKPDFKRANSGSNEGRPGRTQGSGYASSEEVEDVESEKRATASALPTNITKLEFSNYSQVDVKRSGSKASKRYEFEYWGNKYSWKRVAERGSDGESFSYHLLRGDSTTAVAHIVPELRSPSQNQAARDSGSWVPPCSMWISDNSVLDALTDVADVIVATGLIALVDDCIKRHFNHEKPTLARQLSSPLKLDMRPMAMVEHIFKRRNSAGSSKSRDGQKKSPLRFANAIEAF